MCASKGCVNAFVTRTLLSYDGSHDLEHARRVSTNAAHMFSGPYEELPVVVAAAFGHDTCDPKYDGRSRLGALERMCLQDGMSYDDAVCVRRVVEHVSFSRLRREGPPVVILSAREMRVWRCVTDADMLEAMGATGMVRTLMYQGHCGCDLDAALSYAEEALLQCIHYIENKCARAEGMQRQETMRRWIRECKTMSPLRSLSDEIMLRGRRGSSFASAERLLHRGGSDSVIETMAREAEREALWTVV